VVPRVGADAEDPRPARPATNSEGGVEPVSREDRRPPRDQAAMETPAMTELIGNKGHGERRPECLPETDTARRRGTGNVVDP
jgi:hypothetical protein